jgi:hypothetical protein
MKRVFSIFIVIVLAFTIVSFADSDDDQSSPIKEAGDYIFCPVMPITRGSNLPSTVYSLNNSYWGTAYFSVGVYTNCLFTDHNGSIQIEVSNSNDIPDDDYYMQVKLCHKNFWGSQVVDDTVSVGVNDEATLVFSGLNTNTKYFFQFSQSFQTYPTTTTFTIQRAY